MIFQSLIAVACLLLVALAHEDVSQERYLKKKGADTPTESPSKAPKVGPRVEDPAKRRSPLFSSHLASSHCPSLQQLYARLKGSFESLTKVLIGQDWVHGKKKKRH